MGLFGGKLAITQELYESSRIMAVSIGIATFSM